jgi:hypothetical protein
MVAQALPAQSGFDLMWHPARTPADTTLVTICGSYAGLMQLGGLYANLFELQARHYLS